MIPVVLDAKQTPDGDYRLEGETEEAWIESNKTVVVRQMN